MDKYAALLEYAKFYELVSLAEKVYGPYYSGKENRKLVIIKYDDGSTKTISYPKYLMQKHLKRELLPNETVDHRDRNHSNDAISNLCIMPRSEHSSADTRRVRLVRFNCSLCNKSFERSPRLVRDKSKKGKRGIFCSRQCAGRYARQLQLGLIDKFPVQPYIESEYYRNVKAVALYIINKYGIKLF